MVIVTGASGHLGTVLVRELINRGEEVKYVTRSGVPQALAGLPARPVAAELDDEDTVAEAARGATAFYHCAALISILPGHARELHRVNVEGTRHMLSAARRAGVPRFVHVGTIEAFPLEGAASPITEESGYDPDRTVMEYGRSKALSIADTVGASNEGMHCVVCCPTAMIGPPDYRRSALGEVIYDFMHGKLPAYVSGGFDFVDVRDVAAALITAADRGRPGGVYLLSGQFWTIPELMSMLEAASGVRKPRMRISAGLLRPIMPLVQGFYRVTGKPPRFTNESLHLLSLNVRVDSSLAKEEIGFTARPTQETIADTVEWFRST